VSFCQKIIFLFGLFSKEVHHSHCLYIMIVFLFVFDTISFLFFSSLIFQSIAFFSLFSPKNYSLIFLTFSFQPEEQMMKFGLHIRNQQT